MKFHFGQIEQSEICTEVSFTSPEAMWTVIRRLPYTEVKSLTGLSSLRVSCKRALPVRFFQNICPHLEHHPRSFQAILTKVKASLPVLLKVMLVTRAFLRSGAKLICGNFYWRWPLISARSLLSWSKLKAILCRLCRGLNVGCAGLGSTYGEYGFF